MGNNKGIQWNEKELINFHQRHFPLSQQLWQHPCLPLIPLSWELGPQSRLWLWGVLQCWLRAGTVCPSLSSSGSDSHPSLHLPAPLPLWWWLSPEGYGTAAGQSGDARACPWCPAGTREAGRLPDDHQPPWDLEKGSPSFSKGGRRYKWDLGRHKEGKGGGWE